MQILECEGDVSPDVSFRRNGSLSCVLPFLLLDSIPRNSFSYDKLPENPLKLTVLKLDGSSFDIGVAKNATVAELKRAVEAAFNHLPRSGAGMVSWSHVWGHFCLSYCRQKLLTDSDLIGTYGIKDGDELSFVRHVSISYNLVKTQSEREDRVLEGRRISKGFEGRHQKGQEDDNHHQDIIKNHQLAIAEDENYGGVVTGCEFRLGHLFKRWFSYRKLARSGRRMERMIK